MTEVSAAAEEARKEVEGVVLLTGSAALLVLLDAVMAVFVVDLAILFFGEDFVGRRYLDEFLGCCVVTASGS